MEELSFSWVLQNISGRQCNLPLIPTYIILENKPISLAFVKDEKLQIAHAQIKSLKDLFTKFINDNIFRSKFHSIEPILCYVITRKERYRLKERDIREFMELNTIKNIQYIQGSRPRCEDYEIYYVLRLEYTKSRYVSQFYKQVDYEKKVFYDSRIFEYTVDIANMIMAIIENCTKKRVMIMEIEFLEDIDRRIWVSFIREMKIAEPVLCMHYVIKTPDDLKSIPLKSPSVTKFTKLANGQHIMQRKHQMKPPIDYTFVKGHIRNKKSNIAIDLSIQIPDQYHVSETPEENAGNNGNALFRTLSIKKGPVKSSTPRPRSSSRYDSRRAQALRDEIMKSPELKTKYRLTGLVGVLSIEMQKKFHRSFSDSHIEDDDKRYEKKKRIPRSRLILKEGTPTRLRSFSPRYLKSK